MISPIASKFISFTSSCLISTPFVQTMTCSFTLLTSHDIPFILPYIVFFTLLIFILSFFSHFGQGGKLGLSHYLYLGLWQLQVLPPNYLFDGER